MAESNDSTIGWLIIIGAVALFYFGCDNVKSSPKAIDADGQSYLACKGMVWVSSEGGGLLGGSQSFKVSFTDAAGLSHTLRGLKKVEVSDIPPMMNAACNNK